MTYEEIEYEFMECVDKGIITITYNKYTKAHTYSCTHSCDYTLSSDPVCPLGTNVDRWCKYDGEHYKSLLAKVYQTHPELFI